MLSLITSGWVWWAMLSLGLSANPPAEHGFRNFVYHESPAAMQQRILDSLQAFPAEAYRNEAPGLIQKEWLGAPPDFRPFGGELSFLIGQLWMESDSPQPENALPFLWQAWRSQPQLIRYRDGFMAAAEKMGVSLPPIPAWHYFYLGRPDLLWMLTALATLWTGFGIFLVRQMNRRYPSVLTLLILLCLGLFVFSALGVFSHYRWKRMDLVPHPTVLRLSPADYAEQGESLPALSWVHRIARKDGFVEVSSPQQMSGWVPLSTFDPPPFPEADS